MNGEASLVEEEVEALSAIYGDEFFIVDPENKYHVEFIISVDISRIYSINIPSETVSSENLTSFEFRFVPGYPTDAKLEYKLRAQWMPRSCLGQLTNIIDEIVRNSDDSPIVHLLVETIRSFLQSELPKDESEQHSFSSLNPSLMEDESKPNKKLFNTVPTVKAHLVIQPERFPLTSGQKPPHIYHGEPYIDRKSVFQAHCARVTSLAEVSLFISELLEDRKIASATHNILAWRIVRKDQNGVHVASDCDDDGETHAGGRLLHLLMISEAENVVVMVSRWFGGILLGPDRFKHINNVARSLLIEQNMLSHSNGTTQKKQKHKDRKK